jgi:hypothetical protein
MKRINLVQCEPWYTGNLLNMIGVNVNIDDAVDQLTGRVKAAPSPVS